MNKQDTYDHLLYEANQANQRALTARSMYRAGVVSKHDLDKAEVEQDVAMAAFTMFARRNEKEINLRRS